MDDRTSPQPSQRRSAQDIEQACNAYESQCRQGESPQIEHYLERAEREIRPELLCELVALDVEYRQQQGENVDLQEYRQRFPEYAERLEAAWTSIVGHWSSDTKSELAESRSENTDVNVEQEPQSSGGGSPAPAPTQFGRYQVREVLGHGGFGTVYRAWDPKLERQVAVKVPTRKFLSSSRIRELYLDEARAVAQLDHPHIVPVHDADKTVDGDFFAVSKYIEGCDLATHLEDQRPSAVQCAAWVAQIAEALHYAHTQGFVHRDVKPANILIDKSGHAHLTDFGLAMRDETLGQGPGLIGTLSYMSPEQISGQGHRVDGRSDVFSLGVVLYELLTGRRPFRSTSQAEITEQIRSMEAKPPRQIDDSIPPELERICLKAIAKPVNDRYLTAQDLAGELNDVLSGLSQEHGGQPDQDRSARSPSSRRWIVGIGGCVLLATIYLLVTTPWRQREETVSASGADNAAPISGARDDIVVVDEFLVTVSRDNGLSQPVDAMVPLQSGDCIRFSVRLNQPAYVRLLWIDADGQLQELYPNDPEEGYRGEGPIKTMESPIQFDSGWPLEGNEGVETAVLLVNKESTVHLDLAELRTTLPIGKSLSSVRRFEATRTESASVCKTLDEDRTLGTSTKRVDNGVLHLLEQLRRHADIVKATVIPHDDSP